MESPHEELPDNDQAELSAYRAVSISALAALGLGLVGSAALLWWPFIFLPVAAVLVAMFSLRAIAENRPSLIGRKAALAGLALGLLFGSATPAHLATHQWLLRSRARQFTDDWFDLVRRGRLKKAHRLTLPHVRRASSDLSLKSFYEGRRDTRNEYDADVVRSLVEAGRSGRFDFEKTVKTVSGSGKEYVVELFTLTYRKDGAGAKLPVRVVVERTGHPKKDLGAWRIYSLHKPKETTGTDDPP